MKICMKLRVAENILTFLNFMMHFHSHLRLPYEAFFEKVSILLLKMYLFYPDLNSPNTSYKSPNLREFCFKLVHYLIL